MKHRIQGMIIGFLVATLLFSGVITVFAAPALKWQKIEVAYADYKVVIDGVQFEAKDKNGVIEPFLYNGWIYAPFEHIAKALGKTASWDGDTHTLYLGAKTVVENSVKLSKLDYFTNEGKNFRHNDQVQINTGDYLNDCYSVDFSGGKGKNSTVDYLINSQYNKITGTIYLDYEGRSAKGVGKFHIWGDNKLFYSSDEIKAGFMPLFFEINISGVQTLKIGFEMITYAGGNGRLGVSNVTLYKK